MLRTTDPVDFVISVYNEDPSHLALTLRSCLAQPRVGTIVVVDDGSERAMRLPVDDPRICLVRLDANAGISSARNRGISMTRSSFVACVNSEIEIAPDWLDATCAVLDRYHTCGAAFTALRVPNERRWWTQWRTAYHELPMPPHDGPSKFAPGHAVLFRRAALDEVGGYDQKWIRCHEDVDICLRLAAAHWSTRFTSRSACVSRQIDSPMVLGRKEAVRALRCTNATVPVHAAGLRVMRRGMMRVGSSIAHGRWTALAVEPLILGIALWEAVRIGSRSARGGATAATAPTPVKVTTHE